jgi:putative glutamine amidotransferase
LGGSLHQNLAEVDGRFIHNPDQSLDAEGQYGPAHTVRLAADGYLARLFDKTEILVNSIHRQGIDRLAEGLAVEATADDGQIEAVRVLGSSGFAIAVQWHPEWRFWENRESAALLKAFGNAMVDYGSKSRAQAAE